MAILRGIKFSTALAALALFFLPWLDIRCSGKSIATQTGFQTIIGDATPSEEMRDERSRNDKKKEPLGNAPLVAVALGATGIGTILLLLAFLASNVNLERIGSGLCVLALVMLVMQVMQGFPAKDELVSAISSDQASNETEMANLLATQAMANLKVNVLPAFYITCSLLGLQTLLLIHHVVDRLRD